MGLMLLWFLQIAVVANVNQARVKEPAMLNSDA